MLKVIKAGTATHLETGKAQNEGVQLLMALPARGRRRRGRWARGTTRALLLPPAAKSLPAKGPQLSFGDEPPWARVPPPGPFSW